MPAPLVKRLDQLALATLVAAALAAMAAWWLVRGGSSGRLINIERAAPLNYAFRIDVNQAEWPELAQLPEVGEVLARRIVEHRGRNGPFKRRADLLAVRGIGDKTLERFRNYLLPLPGEEMTAGP